jgi:osmotically inducible lipoprotein OsmB
MSTIRRQLAAASCALLALALGACADMTREQKDTAIGAGVGGVAGSVLTNGSTTGTLGGAAIGGVIGNQAGKGK